jgi:hypothetical protein
VIGHDEVMEGVAKARMLISRVSSFVHDLEVLVEANPCGKFHFPMSRKSIRLWEPKWCVVFTKQVQVTVQQRTHGEEASSGRDRTLQFIHNLIIWEVVGVVPWSESVSKLELLPFLLQAMPKRPLFVPVPSRPSPPLLYPDPLPSQPPTLAVHPLGVFLAMTSFVRFASLQMRRHSREKAK